MSKFNSHDNVTSRLVRLESKLVRGFEELGVSLDVQRDWLTVDNAAKIVYVATVGRSISVIVQEMKARGATHLGDFYEVIHKGDAVAHVLYDPKF
jgi:hypothetical protein|tara:strand:+ start:682 stop:966 length:285 start_codon:yes stop_codon:yes gene_type:complete